MENGTSSVDRRQPKDFSWLISVVGEDLDANHGHWERGGFHALAVYRFGTWAQAQGGLLGFAANAVYKLVFGIVRNFYSIDIARGTKVGRRLSIPHPAGIVIKSTVEIGDDCMILQNVTIGGPARRKGRLLQAPRIGDRVQIGAGAVIIGGITIGDDARVGPNSVVMTDVPPGATAFAPAAKIMKPLIQLDREKQDPTLEKGKRPDG